MPGFSSMTNTSVIWVDRRNFILVLLQHSFSSAKPGKWETVCLFVSCRWVIARRSIQYHKTFIAHEDPWRPVDLRNEWWMCDTNIPIIVSYSFLEVIFEDTPDVQVTNAKKPGEKEFRSTWFILSVRNHLIKKTSAFLAFGHLPM